MVSEAEVQTCPQVGFTSPDGKPKDWFWLIKTSDEMTDVLNTARSTGSLFLDHSGSPQ